MDRNKFIGFLVICAILSVIWPREVLGQNEGLHFSGNIEAGQLLLSAIMSLVSYIFKRELSRLDKRLERHDQIIDNLTKDTSRIIGFIEGKKGIIESS